MTWKVYLEAILKEGNFDDLKEKNLSFGPFKIETSATDEDEALSEIKKHFSYWDNYNGSSVTMSLSFEDQEIFSHQSEAQIVGIHPSDINDLNKLLGGMDKREKSEALGVLSIRLEPENWEDEPLHLKEQ